MVDWLRSRRSFIAGGSTAILAPRLAMADAIDRPADSSHVAASDWLDARPGVPILGRPGGNLVIVEFMDYRCGFCRALQPTFARLLADVPALAIGVAEWPIYGDVSAYAARLALIASRHAVFRSVHEALLAARDDRRDAVLATAVAAGLPDALAADPVSVAWADEQLAAIAKDAAAMRFKGTPALLLGRKVVRGALSYADLRDLLMAEANALDRTQPK